VSTASPSTQLVCVEIGGGGVETVLLDEDGTATRLDGLAAPDGLPLLIAVPGIIEDGRVVIASNLGWYDVDPAAQLGLPAPAALVGNDAETAALGESALRGGTDLVFLGLGTGVGGAVLVEQDRLDTAATDLDAGQLRRRARGAHVQSSLGYV
jgi:hypothetical protein